MLGASKASVKDVPKQSTGIIRKVPAQKPPIPKVPVTEDSAKEVKPLPETPMEKPIVTIPLDEVTHTG